MAWWWCLTGNRGRGRWMVAAWRNTKSLPPLAPLPTSQNPSTAAPSPLPRSQNSRAAAAPLPTQNPSFLSSSHPAQPPPNPNPQSLPLPTRSSPRVGYTTKPSPPPNHNNQLPSFNQSTQLPLPPVIQPLQKSSSFVPSQPPSPPRGALDLRILSVSLL